MVLFLYVLMMLNLNKEDESKKNTINKFVGILTAGLLGEKYIGIVPGADDTFIKNGDEIEQTQSALVLEDLIGKFLFNKATEDKSSNSNAAATPAPAANSQDDF